MACVALPLVLPIDNLTPREWTLGRTPGQGPQNYTLTLQLHGDREAQAVSAQMNRIQGPIELDTGHQSAGHQSAGHQSTGQQPSGHQSGGR